MNKKYYLGIDIGTYETKGVIVNIQGEIIAQSSKRHELIVPQRGWAEHRPLEDWWNDFSYICKDLIKLSNCDPKNIKAVTASAIGPCMLPVDKSGSPLMNAVLYGVDTRSFKEIEELNYLIGQKKIIDFGGNPLTSQSIGPKILWLKKNKKSIFSKTHKILNSTSYINYKLTNNYCIDHFSAANFTPFYDIKKLCWSVEIAPNIINLDILPKLVWTNDFIGKVTIEASKETGLAEGTLITAGTIDAAAEALSVGVINPKDMMMMYGSTMFFISLTKEPIFDNRLWYAPWLFKGEHCSLAGLATSGTLTQWFRKEFAKEIKSGNAFEELANEAESSPVGSNGIIFLPYFSGERTPIHDINAKGTFFGLNLTHKRSDFYRSIFEGIAYGTKHVFDTYEELKILPKNLYGVGGGTKNKLWSQTTSDIIRINQTLRKITYGASYGDAFLSALACDDIIKEDINKWNPVDNKIVSKNNIIYEKGYKNFKKLYYNTKDLMKDLDN
ncbi:FGGY-family carbohydrate kinase [Alphaproteobacteria bacterium]|nr:FGGY-family carbohydrate kinase [Alphaproteobacteria bacterium]